MSMTREITISETTLQRLTKHGREGVPFLRNERDGPDGMKIIDVEEETYDRLMDQKTPDESFDQAISRLMNWSGEHGRGKGSA